jgi:hypothetical protein
MRTPELRVTASPRSMALLATAIVCIGCTAPAAQESQSPSETAASTSTSMPSARATPSEGPSASPTAGSTDTPAPTLAFEAPPGVLPPGSFAVVTGDGLRLRETPTPEGRVITTLRADDRLEVHIGRWTSSDGTEWYQVALDGNNQGWAAAEAGDKRFLALETPTCPTGEPDLADITALSGWERLACFGDRSITVEGTWGCSGCGGTNVGTLEPRWLAGLSFALLWVDWGPEWGIGNSLVLRFSPESQLDDSPAQGSILRVTGHFNDPVATTCVIRGVGYLESDAPAETAELYCREGFVVEGYEVIGNDPDFPEFGG